VRVLGLGLALARELVWVLELVSALARELVRVQERALGQRKRQSIRSPGLLTELK